MFQYPLRVEWCWNGTARVHALDVVEFQYPLRVEWCWNLEASNALYTVFSGFSTLYGSNGVGTSGLARCIIVIPGFSTLYGSNGVGTLLEHEVDHVLMYVSVPSTGRMVLEHCQLTINKRPEVCFSTLYGSNGVGT